MDNTIEDALLVLSALDQDGATQRNNVGFNGRDSAFGNSLASQIQFGKNLSHRQKEVAYSILRKYRVQLSNLGVDFAKIEEPKELTPITNTYPPITSSITIENDTAVIDFGGYPGEKLLSLVKPIPGRTYKDGIWTVPITSSNVIALNNLTQQHSFTLHNWEALVDLSQEFVNNVEESHALDADIEIPNLSMPLMPFQKAGVAYAIKNLSKGKGVYIADEMGLGKTVQGLSILEYKEAYPALIIVPKVVVLNWVKEIKKWLPHHTVTVLGGKSVSKNNVKAIESVGALSCGLTETLPDTDVYIVNYDLLSKWVGPKGKKVGQGMQYTVGGPLKDLDLKGIILDECHLVKDRKALRTKAAAALVRTFQPEVTLALSGTPIPNRPSELITVIKDILNRLPDVGGWQSLWWHHCEGDSRGSHDLEGLNNKMRAAFYVRRLKKDVLPELPPVRWINIPVMMSNPKNYDDVERDLSNWYKTKLEKDPMFLLQMLNYSEEKREKMLKEKAQSQVSAYSEVLVKINALRQTAANEKLQATIEWLEEWLADSGDEKIIVFGIHRAINEAISEYFKAPLIYGGMDSATRLANENAFQNSSPSSSPSNPSNRMLVCSIDAAGIGLTLTAATNVAFVEMPWRPMDLDQAVGRAYGRLSDVHGATAYIITVPDTIEDNIVKLIEKKRNLIAKGADGTSSIIDELIADVLGETT